jgi:hypothetical protein
VTRLGNILPFGLLLLGLGDFLEKIRFVVGILRVLRVFDVDVWPFKLSFGEDILAFLVWQLFWLIFQNLGYFLPNFCSPWPGYIKGYNFDCS